MTMGTNAEERAALLRALLAVIGDTRHAEASGIIARETYLAMNQALGMAAHALRTAREVEGDTTPMLSEFIKWPCDRMRCPKCGSSREGRRQYQHGAVERIRHTCRCGYAIYTKTEDAP